VIVTVSRCYGASSLLVSRRAAERLGYRLVHNELPVVVAARLGMPADVVESVADRPPSFGERVLVQLGGALPETAQPAARTDADIAIETRRAIEDAVRDAVAGGDAIVLGRMASAILAGRPDLVRVFLHAPLAWRITNVAASLGVSDALARAEIARIDEARRTYAREGYRVTWGDPRNYDLVVDVSRFGVEGSAELIVAAVRSIGA
jgi:cytidylate kinase